jgi:hypothetical protein
MGVCVFSGIWGNRGGLHGSIRGNMGIYGGCCSAFRAPHFVLDNLPEPGYHKCTVSVHLSRPQLTNI